VLLIRHGSAGERAAWTGDDRERPLDEKGEDQAERLVALLAAYGIDRILSSPALRCVATVEPLARARELPIELRHELSEEEQGSAGADLVRSLAASDAAVCGHGGLEQAALPAAPRWQKGAVLVVDADLRAAESLRA
jgi:phosphohistidine phosphatase SixA